MGRWPTERNGRPVSPYERGFAIPAAEDYGVRRRVNIHHGIFPWSAVSRNAISLTFASLRSNTFPMLAEEHNMGRYNLHREYDAPKMPSFTQMIGVMEEELAQQGILTCVYHKKTHETYQLNAVDLGRIVRSGYNK